MWDYHIHSKYCRHASGTLEDYVKTAISKNMIEIGFSEHIPMEFLPESVPRDEYGMPLSELEQYFSDIAYLQQKYKNEISIKVGMEIDYFPWNISEIKRFISQYEHKLDYIIGSIHMIESEAIGIWPIDDERPKYRHVNEIGVDAMYDAYFDNIEALIKSGLYNILGHLDLPKKYGERYSTHAIYMERVRKILDMAKKSQICIEINTAGLRKPVKEQYPSEDIIEEIVKRKIPIILDSDSHRPEDIGFDFPHWIKWLKDRGVTEMAAFDKRRLIMRKI